MRAERRFVWHRFFVDQGAREVVSLVDDRPPLGAHDRHSLDVTGWLPASPANVAAVRALCAWLNAHCPAGLTADEFWAGLHSDEGDEG